MSGTAAVTTSLTTRPGTAAAYLTDGGHSLAPVPVQGHGARGTVAVRPRSLTTIVVDGRGGRR
ncbi:hypothetical protein IMZ11_24730 [Microtetraspora sp. AC03309]|uniref:hypothetical protein n=1 Tax=Microtetraspora sp. AC03309 TaxID=2779376 RepID=UPI001E33CD54|nr:hypothetical protein [Microtetraspora sp. AC03309]MCC5578837.1 hypothetical protein [Microtetraspora sp. AC03309]